MQRTDAWALSRASAETQAAFKSAEVSRRDALGAPPGKLAAAPPAAAGAAGPPGVDMGRASSGRGPLRDLHFKDVMPPDKYTGTVANWLQWSQRFRSYRVARTDERLGELLTCVEQLRGRPLTLGRQSLSSRQASRPGRRGSTSSWMLTRVAQRG